MPTDSNPSSSNRPDLTELLGEVATGSKAASEQLLDLIYFDLKDHARRFMRRERNRITLQTTALVHDAYLMLVKRRDNRWLNRDQFFAHAAMAMRRLLIDYARARQAMKRGGKQPHEPLSEDVPEFSVMQTRQLLALNDALITLEAHDPQMARYVELRFFGGMSHKEAGDFVGMNERAASRAWRFTRAWLYGQVTGLTQ